MLTSLFAAIAVTLGMVAPTAAPAVKVASPNTATLKGGLYQGDPRQMLPQLCPCADLNYQSTYASQQQLFANATQQISAWIDTHPDGVVIGFSQGASVAMTAANNHPKTKFLFLGNPDSPSNVDPAWAEYRKRNKIPRPPITANMTFIVREYDQVSDKPADATNKLAMQNLMITTHLNGYRNVNLNDPRNVVVIDPVTGSKTIYLPSDVLPMLQARDWYTSDAEMKRLDALYRPTIDAAYANNPGRPYIPAGPNRSTPSTTTINASVQEVGTTATTESATSARSTVEQPISKPTTKKEQRRAERKAERAERKAERATKRAERKAARQAKRGSEASE